MLILQGKCNQLQLVITQSIYIITNKVSIGFKSVNILTVVQEKVTQIWKRKAFYKSIFKTSHLNLLILLFCQSMFLFLFIYALYRF